MKTTHSEVSVPAFLSFDSVYSLVSQRGGIEKAARVAAEVLATRESETLITFESVAAAELPTIPAKGI